MVINLSTRTCTDLQSQIDSLLADGYRLDMIMPADEPREAIVSKDGASLRLTENHPVSETVTSVRCKAGSFQHDTQNWIKGRAGMEYRDLIPDRLDGRIIASHIRIVEGGDVPDYVHYHKIRFQMIYCKSGWVRVVYEDQGPPFVLNAGDCVLQPPEIRHRVLESSAGAEVIEVSSPAVQETWVEHDLKLPTAIENPERVFNEQRFVRFVASEATFMSHPNGGEYADTGIDAATSRLASVRVCKIAAGSSIQGKTGANGKRPSFLFMLGGRIKLQRIAAEPVELQANDSYVLAGQYEVTADVDSEILEVLLPQD